MSIGLHGRMTYQFVNLLCNLESFTRVCPERPQAGVHFRFHTTGSQRSILQPYTSQVNRVPLLKSLRQHGVSFIFGHGALWGDTLELRQETIMDLANPLYIAANLRPDRKETEHLTKSVVESGTLWGHTLLRLFSPDT